MYKGLRDTNSVFSGILARYGFSASVASRGQTDRASGEVVTGNYFEVLGSAARDWALCSARMMTGCRPLNPTLC